MKKYRQERIEKEICRVISKLLYEDARNPKVLGIVTVTRARVTPDMKYCDIYVSVMGESEKETVLEGLNEMRGYFRKRIAEEIRLRYTPEVRVKIDDSIEYGIKISKILSDLKEEEGQ